MVYSYNAFDRMVGRRVETATLSGGTPPAASDWKLSTETSTAPGALPPSVTFVWDPLSDQLVAMFEAEKYESGSVVTSGRPPRQFIHSGLGLDDPIEVAVADASAPNGVKRYYPILDEAGAGSLQAVVGESGELVARTILADPFGEDASTITGPAVDRVTISGSKDTSGAATEVKVEMHLTEPVDAATIARGTRLAAVTSSGAVVATSAITPVLADGYTVRWTLPATEWNALASSPGAVSLSIAATNMLRSTTFGSSTAVLVPRSAPSGVFASAERPFELREPLAAIAEQFANAPSGGTFSATPYSVLAIASIGTRATTDIGASLVFSPFKAHSFSDAFTGWDYVRARWLDRSSGVFLTPDPVGYRDSSNLYAFCGGDPVNCSDPSGMYEEDVHHYLTWFLAQAAGFDDETAWLIGFHTQQLDMDARDAMFRVHSLAEATGGALSDLGAYLIPGFPSNPANMRDYHMVTEARLAAMQGGAMRAISQTWWDDPADINQLTGVARRRYSDAMRWSLRWSAVGEYLHALEDSYSHQKGRYDRDFSQTYNTFSGHALDFHYNDWTWTRSELAMKMARNVYDELVALCKQTGRRCGGGASWGEIEGAVESFALTLPQRSREVQFFIFGVPAVVSYQNKVDELRFTTRSGRQLGGFTVVQEERDRRLASYQAYQRARQRTIPVFRVYPR